MKEFLSMLVEAGLVTAIKKAKMGKFTSRTEESTHFMGCGRCWEPEGQYNTFTSVNEDGKKSFMCLCDKCTAITMKEFDGILEKEYKFI